MSTLAVSALQIGGNAAVKFGTSAALSYANSAISRVFDNRVFEGPRLDSFHLQTSRDGAPMSRIYGRIRLAGQVIWASRLKEVVTEERVQSGKGGGPTQRNFSYTISFAIGLCEGEIFGVDRLWANGVPLNIPGLTLRVYKGDEDQLPDPIISAIEGGDVPSFRGTAYIVFEDFPLDDFGARMPQINAEIIRVPPRENQEPRLETMIRGVNLLPGSGEFAYASNIVEETPTPTSARPINMNNLSGLPDIELALDQLETQLPNVKNVSIITSWFGTDLRCGECEIKPGIENKVRVTPEARWQVSGITRGNAYEVSRDEQGEISYGGTPSDASIIQAIRALRSRGYKVTLYPFILMDIPADNDLPDPYGGPRQAAFPWRGQISSMPLSAENSAAANAQVDSFFGTAKGSDFGQNGELPSYTGPNEFSFRRFILHYAKLAQIAGGVDRFAIGSEMVGLTTLRGAGDSYPAVAKFVELAADVRALVGSGVGLTYAADWTEYFGHQPQDGSGDVSFHLDPLWSSGAIDAIGIDAYFPLADWREGESHIDAQSHDDNYDLNYLSSQMEGGEGYDYFYASQADRDSQARSPIADGSANKPWVYRYKDLRNWWSQPHYNRRGGQEVSAPTLWTPQSKPIWLMEIGCPAINKGANQPNVFFDAKSVQSQFPYYSTAGRDDLIQRRYLEAFIGYWDEEAGNNPQSNLYAGHMIDTDMINVWAWDARPFPDFPARSSVWSDGDNWQRGHWLTGRMGLVPLADVVADICAQSGLGAVNGNKLTGLVQGYHLDRPLTGRGALTPLANLYGFNMIETAQGLSFASFGTEAKFSLEADDIIGNLSEAISMSKDDPEARLKDVRVHFIDAANDYQLGMASARDRAAQTVRILDINAPIVSDQSFARFTAERLLARAHESDRVLNLELTGQRLEIEVGDLLALPHIDGAWQIETMEGLTTQRVQARRIGQVKTLPLTGTTPAAVSQPLWQAKPVLFAADIAGDYEGPLVGVGLDPFSVSTVSHGDSQIGLDSPAHIGASLSVFKAGPIGRWDRASSLDIYLPNLALSSALEEDVLGGVNRFAIETDTGWEVFQAAQILLTAPETYQLKTFLRGQAGSDADMMEEIAEGARVIWLGSGWSDIAVPEDMLGAEITLSTEAAGREGEPLSHLYKGTYLRPLAPVHVKAAPRAGGLELSWIRRSRIGGDSWQGLDIPLGEDGEFYRVQLWAGAELQASFETTAPELFLEAGALGGIDNLTIAQGSRRFGWGAVATLPL